MESENFFTNPDEKNPDENTEKKLHIQTRLKIVKCRLGACWKMLPSRNPKNEFEVRAEKIFTGSFVRFKPSGLWTNSQKSFFSKSPMSVRFLVETMVSGKVAVFIKKNESDFGDLSKSLAFCRSRIIGCPRQWTKSLIFYSLNLLKKKETWIEALKNEVNQWLLQSMTKCIETW